MSDLVYTKTPLPVVNNSNIANHIDSFVVINGKNGGVNNSTMTLIVDEENKNEVMITNFTKELSVGKYVKIIGKVGKDRSIEFVDYIQMQDDLDLQIINDVIGLMSHPELAGLFNS